MADERHDSDILSCVLSALQIIFVSPASYKSEYGRTFLFIFPVHNSGEWQEVKGVNVGGKGKCLHVPKTEKTTGLEKQSKNTSHVKT